MVFPYEDKRVNLGGRRGLQLKYFEN